MSPSYLIAPIGISVWKCPCGSACRCGHATFCGSLYAPLTAAGLDWRCCLLSVLSVLTLRVLWVWLSVQMTVLLVFRPNPLYVLLLLGALLPPFLLNTAVAMYRNKVK